MELFIAIALLCQVSTGSTEADRMSARQLRCQQYYSHCVKVKGTKLPLTQAIDTCIQERSI